MRVGAVAVGRCCPQGHNAWRVRRDGSYQCIPCDRESARKRLRLRREIQPLEDLWRGTRDRARAKQLAFTITVADIEALWPASGQCPVLDIPLVRGVGFTHDGSPTLDRLNNQWGYEPGNVAVISLRANRAKGNLQAKELEAIAAWMRRNGLD